MAQLENISPQIFKRSESRAISAEDENDDIEDDFDSREIFDYIKNIKDPEHPLSLEELNVVREEQIAVNSNEKSVVVYFSPTVPHCSMATLIGLSLKVQLLRVLPPSLKVTVLITPGTHASENAVNKQLNDKERVAAALENNHLMEVINQCIAESLLPKAG